MPKLVQANAIYAAPGDLLRLLSAAKFRTEAMKFLRGSETIWASTNCRPTISLSNTRIMDSARDRLVVPV